MGVILGLDPGQRRDPAGLAVVEGFDVLHLERHLGLPYPELAERVAVLLAQLPPASLVAGGQPRCTVGGYADCMRAEAAAVRATPVVVDATGVGRAVVDLLEALHLTPIAVTLTGGGKVRVSGRELSLPRRVLFLPLQAAMEAGRLRVAEGCPYRAELAAELLAARGGASGAESRGKGHHGDLMTAVALAVWWCGLASTKGHRRGDGPGPRVTGSAGRPSRDGTSDAGARGLGPGVRTAKA